MEWQKVFSTDQHHAYKDLVANLLPLSSSMNSSLGNDPYPIKKVRYSEDSMFKATREFAKKYSTWTPKELKQRAEKISEWALSRWK